MGNSFFFLFPFFFFFFFIFKSSNKSGTLEVSVIILSEILCLSVCHSNPVFSQRATTVQRSLTNFLYSIIFILPSKTCSTVRDFIISKLFKLHFHYPFLRSDTYERIPWFSVFQLANLYTCWS